MSYDCIYNKCPTQLYSQQKKGTKMTFDGGETFLKANELLRIYTIDVKFSKALSNFCVLLI